MRAAIALVVGIVPMWAGCAGSPVDSPEGDVAERPATEPLHWSHAVASELRPDTGAVDDSFIEGAWVEAPSGGWYSKLTAKWTVPIAPVATYTASSPQMFDSMWPGLEDAAATIVAQPVLYYGYGPEGGGNSWTLECYFSTASSDVHSTPLAVHPGDALSATITSTGCNATGGSCTWTCTATDVTTGGSTTKTDTLTQTLNVAWGGVLEVSQLGSCLDFPVNGPTALANLALYDKTGTAVTPAWTINNYNGTGGLPNDQGVPCSFGTSDTSSSVTLKYTGYLCDPSRKLPHFCCAYSGGCTCEGTQTCQANGEYSACVGSTPAGGNPIDCN